MVACIDDCSGGHDYQLPGPQVEPSAGLWQFCAKLRIVSVDEMRKLTDNPKDVHYFPPYPTDPKVIAAEYDELQELVKHRDDPCFIAAHAKAAKPPDVCDIKKELPGKTLRWKPLSRLWNIMPSRSSAPAAGWGARLRARRPASTTATSPTC
jgi:hypothetical protein